MKSYTRREIEMIAAQLRAVKLSGTAIFSVKIIPASRGVYICIEAEGTTANLQFLLASEQEEDKDE